MNFEQEINMLENSELDFDYSIYKGNIPILFSAPHTMKQLRDDGTTKLNEPYTKAIALYLNKYCNTFAIVKNNDTGVDSNRDNYDEYNVEMRRLIKDNNIKLVIDLHGASSSRDFDVEFGTMNNLSADFSTIRELEEAFTENGIFNVSHNSPFKGGAITQGIYALEDVDVIQLEINSKYRDYNNLNNLKQLINSLTNFIKQYSEYINK
jgi:N-formylglutamate amidohydrolase